MSKLLRVGPLRPVHRDHARRAMNLVVRHINARNHIASSFTGDRRLHNWAVTYDNAIRAMAHMCTGDLTKARQTVDYFIDSRAIRVTGYILRNGKRVAHPGWIMNIVHAATSRAGGWGVERTAHTGPNAYIGMAAAHLYVKTKEPRYLAFARSRWDLIRDLQNDTPGDPNYGGVRMGPLGTPASEAQHLDENRRQPSYYEIYNGEHAADWRGFSLLMADVDPERATAYRDAAELLVSWDRKIWDAERKLFAIGTVERRYYDANIGCWVDPGVVPMHPLDTNALKISAYGVEGLEAFGAGTAVALRQSIDDNYWVDVDINGVTVSGYDFVTHHDRKRLIFWEEPWEKGARKVNRGRGRQPLLSDEWSTWVAFADLRMAHDFAKQGNREAAEQRLATYRTNALDMALRTAIRTEDGDVAYPYAHPLPYALNKPVGFGWNTHHRPYALIGACARVLGLCRFDPYLPHGGADATVISA